MTIEIRMVSKDEARATINGSNFDDDLKRFKDAIQPWQNRQWNNVEKEWIIKGPDLFRGKLDELDTALHEYEMQLGFEFGFTEDELEDSDEVPF